MIRDLIGDFCLIAVAGCVTYLVYLAFYAMYIILKEKFLGDDKKGKH